MSCASRPPCGRCAMRRPSLYQAQFIALGVARPVWCWREGMGGARAAAGAAERAGHRHPEGRDRARTAAVPLGHPAHARAAGRPRAAERGRSSAARRRASRSEAARASASHFIGSRTFSSPARPTRAVSSGSRSLPSQVRARPPLVASQARPRLLRCLTVEVSATSSGSRGRRRCRGRWAPALSDEIADGGVSPASGASSISQWPAPVDHLAADV